MKKTAKPPMIEKYFCTVGDPTPLIQGKRPQCANCKSKKTEGLIELMQYGLWEDKVTTVRKCKECKENTCYTYTIRFDPKEKPE